MSQYHSADPEQDRWLDDATENVKKQAFFMKRALDGQDMREALKCAAAMTGELRTSNLSPKNYYELYMDVTNELRELEIHFEEEDRAFTAGTSTGGRSVVELYEQVQHAGNIVPRLFLLITVGSVYIKTQKAPAKDILFDLVELCRGVQHPMRGLFLRNYLSQISKDKLPDKGTEYEGAGGTVDDALNFVLNNFGEMTKLWVRMQHQGAVRDRQRREKERRNLRQLVGTNLVRLSEMAGVNLDTYRETVLPRVLEQIVNSKDVIAQEYLMDVVIQVFPDEYHLRTLDTFLGTCSQLQKKCNVKGIIISMMNRLSNFARDSRDSVPDDIDMFPLFHKYSSEVINSNTSMTLEDVLQLQVALVNFASNVYPERIDYIDNVLAFSVEQLERAGGKPGQVEDSCEKYVKELLTLPLESLGLRILELQSYAALMTFLTFITRKTVAVSIMGAVVGSQSAIDSLDKLEALFRFISPVLKDQEDTAELTEDDMFEFDQEQHLAARLFHLVRHADTDVQFALFAAARKHYGQGGTKRIVYSLPPLVFGSLALAGRTRDRELAAARANEADGDDAAAAEEEEEADEAKAEPATMPEVRSKKVFGFVHETITVLAPHEPELALRLYLQAAQAADRAGFEAIAYEFVAQAFIVYEDDVSDSRAQFNAITLVVSTLQTFVSFGEENYDTLVTKAVQHSAKLLKKPDQCRAVYNCAQLFWAGTDEKPTHRKEQRVLECLQRSLKIANSCMGSQVHLFVEILNQYLHMYERRCPSITVKYLKGLIALIDEHIPNLDNSETSQLAKRHYQNTLVHIKLKQSLPDEVGERYSQITDED